MRFFAIAADVAMGVLLGIFIYAGLLALWPRLQHVFVGLATVAACILIVLFRRPHGSLAREAGASHGDASGGRDASS